MQKITHGQFVTVKGWNRAYQFSTLTGYAKDKGDDVAEAFARAEKNGHDIAWCVNPGSALLGDRAAAKAMLLKEAEQCANAVIVADGEDVEIEGERFKVRVMGQRYSDPIHFKRVLKITDPTAFRTDKGTSVGHERTATYDADWHILRYWVSPNRYGEDICNSREEAEQLIAATGIAQTLR